MFTAPTWLDYATIRQALLDLGGPHAELIGLVLLVILVAGVGVRWVLLPLLRRR